jgi:oligo-1,6-glucosidase
MSQTTHVIRPTAWWKEVVVYQVYPRSFNDSNGDGIGDLNGLTAKLDYLKKLGIDVVWLSPHFDSPNADNGYDIRDYRQVMAEFGTMADFDRMLEAMKARGIELIVHATTLTATITSGVTANPTARRPTITLRFSGARHGSSTR